LAKRAGRKREPVLHFSCYLAPVYTELCGIETNDDQMKSKEGEGLQLQVGGKSLPLRSHCFKRCFQ